MPYDTNNTNNNAVTIDKYPPQSTMDPLEAITEADLANNGGGRFLVSRYALSTYNNFSAIAFS